MSVHQAFVILHNARAVCKRAMDQELFVWALCASLSMSSSKYILIDLGLYYPFHLHLLQLSTAVIPDAVNLFRSRAGQPLFPTDSRITLLLSLVLPGIVATSSGLLLQAVLHFPNLATLSMLLVGAIA